MAVQVKRWKKNVQSQIVQQVRGSLGTHEQGLRNALTKALRAHGERAGNRKTSLIMPEDVMAAGETTGASKPKSTCRRVSA